MTSFAHVANADYPADVEDLLADNPAEPVSVAAIAGFAVIANAASRALLFGIAAGRGLDAVSIPLQPLPDHRPPALTVWLPERYNEVVHSIGVAVLSSDAILRVFRHLSVSAKSVPTCQQIRVLSSLITSARSNHCLALKVVHIPKANALFVFGSRNSAAIVPLHGSRLAVHPLHRNSTKETSSLPFGSVFYSAIRSISTGIGARDEDWANGSGVHQIVGHGGVNECALLVRAGGEVEKWGAAGLVWSFNIHNLITLRDARNRAESAGVTSDGTLVVLLSNWSQAEQARQLLCFDVRSDVVPTRAEMQEPMKGIEAIADSACHLVVSGDTAYLYVEQSRVLAWLSVARGVPAEGQVRGSISIEYCPDVLAFVDASFGMPDAASKGGISACLHSTGVWIASSSVPAPISVGIADKSSNRSSRANPLSMMWRAFLQYRAGQRGASKASLRGLVNSLDKSKAGEALSQVVHVTSRRVVTSVQDSDKDPIALLVDSDLEKKHGSHNEFLRMLADGDLFSQIRPDAPSIAEDRIWDAIAISARSSLVTDNEKLAAAICLRNLENSFSPRGPNETRNSSMIDTTPENQKNRLGINSITRGSSDQGEKNARDTETMKNVLRLLANEIASRKGQHENAELTCVYRHPYEFHLFLPALQQNMKDELHKLQKHLGAPDNFEASEGAIHRDQLRKLIVLSCDAATAVVHGSLDAREENNRLLSSGPNGMTGVDNWVCERQSCREVLWNMAETALHYSRKMSTIEKPSILKAATATVDEYLSSGGYRYARKQYTSRAQPPTANAHKRRRLNLDHDASEWGRELRGALDMLRRHGLDEEAFRLAEKYEDYGTMLSLKAHTTEFDSFMENSLQKFGEDFAFYAFQWLEQKGQIHLLLRGIPRSEVTSRSAHDRGRSERLITLLSEFLRSDRKKVSNLSWMHWFSIGKFTSGIDSLMEQVEKIGKPEKVGSVTNALNLCSIAKLALLADERTESQISSNQTDRLSYVTAHLFMISLQEEVAPERSALMKGSDLVHRIIEESPTESEDLAKRVLQALQLLEVCESMGDESVSDLGDYVWRRCVERQIRLWVPIAQNLSSINDILLREKLMSTALFKVTQAPEVDSSSISDAIERGAFTSGELDQHGCGEEITKLVRTTVALGTA